MAFCSAMEALGALVHAYYDERSIDATLSCVTDDIEWIGTENNDSAKGKAALRRLLQADVESFPDSFGIELDEPKLRPIGTDGVLITVTGRQVEIPGIVGGFSIRGTACCVKAETGWLVAHVHTSVPNTAAEKYNLERELDATRKKEKLLLSGIPGGVAIYRQKKNGLFYTDYVSDGLARMCGYADGRELCAHLQKNAMINVVDEDIPLVASAALEGLREKKPVSVMYRIHVKGSEDVLQRLDAKQIDTDLLEDDVAVWYAVHTVVSQESLEIIQSRHQLEELIDTVPTGIGIFEVNNGVVSQTYMNKAFYQMLGSSWEERAEYAGIGTLSAAHPDDLPNIQQAVQKLLGGAQLVSTTYRLKLKDNTWFWIRLTAAVVERSENHIRVYGVFSDYNEIIKAEHEMENSRVTLRTALQSAKVLTWRYDYRTGTITDSLTLGETYHLPKVVENVPQSIIDMDFVAPESTEVFRELFVRLQTEDTVSVETKSNIETENGYMWFKQVYVKTFDAAGNYVDCVAVAIDISDQKYREQQYEEQLRLNQVAAQDAFALGTFNLTKNTVMTSESADAKITEDSLDMDTILSHIRQELPADSTFPKTRREMLFRYADGETHFAVRYYLKASARWIESRFDLLTNPYNKDVEVTGIMRDISEAVRAEMVVNKLLDIDYDSIATINIETGIATPFTVSASEVGMKKIMDIQQEQPDMAAGLEGFFRAYCIPADVERAIHENSMPVILKTLETKPIHECVYSLDLGNGIEHKRAIYAYLDANKSFLICAVQNYTLAYEKEAKQKQALEKALQDANAASRAKTAFLSRISHDMRTPLNGILGLTTLLKDSITDKTVDRDLAELELSGQYLLNLINDTLDMNRIESGKMELHPAVCEGRNLFNNTLGLARQNIEAKHIKLTVTADDIPFTILYVDVARIQQVLLNVLGNATKFTPEGGTIDVTMRNLSIVDGVITDEIKIKDSGIGMSKEFLPHVFEAFEQEDSTRTSSTQGTGLGMSITKQLLKLMGGDITAESEPGKGSCFTIIMKMPVATEEQIEDWKKEQVFADDRVVLQGKRVLLCEDHPLNTQIATRLLEVKGIVVEHAENGQIGVELFSRSPLYYYDAVLMDIRMPVMDGLDATRAIRSLPRRDARLVPIIAMTANAFAEDVKQTKEAGMDAHLSKPIQRELLYDALAAQMKIDHTLRQKKILVVDDVEVNRAVIIASLEQDYEILQAENGRQAMELIRRTRGLDAVITDIQMPEMDGVELIRQIRSDPQYRHIVIIANTQFGDPEQEEHLLALGANDFVYKPTTPKIVEIRVRNALNRI